MAGLVGDLDVWLPAGLILVRAHLRNINGARSLACDPILTRLWRRESHVVAHPPCLIAEVGDVLSGGGHVREVRVLGQHAALQRRGQDEGELVVHRVWGMILHTRAVKLRSKVDRDETAPIIGRWLIQALSRKADSSVLVIYTVVSAGSAAIDGLLMFFTLRMCQDFSCSCSATSLN